MRAKHRRAWVGFALLAALVVVGLAVPDGVAAGVILFVAMLEFIGACIYALRGKSSDVMANSERAGLGGWFGDWF